MGLQPICNLKVEQCATALEMVSINILETLKRGSSHSTEEKITNSGTIGNIRGMSR